MSLPRTLLRPCRLVARSCTRLASHPRDARIAIRWSVPLAIIITIVRVSFVDEHQYSKFFSEPRSMEFARGRVNDTSSAVAENDTHAHEQ